MENLNRASADIPMPDRMKSRPVSKTGYAVPWFVTEKDPNGDWDFRVIRPERVVEAFRHDKCWLCGHKLGRYRVFVIGPMCAINRISSEPPSHVECAEYAVRVCPFLSRPKMRRNKEGLPEDAGKGTPGIMLERNPGVTMLWKTTPACYSMILDRDKGRGKGVLFRFTSKPDEVLWYSEGRTATREEVMYSVETGLPALQALADAEGDSGRKALAKAREVAQPLFDAIPTADELFMKRAQAMPLTDALRVRPTDAV